MAKTVVKLMAVQGLSARTKRLMDALRRPFEAFSGRFLAITESRADLAPKLVEAYDSFKKDTNNGRFVDFVRLLDPSLPMERAEYRDHPAYNAATYLRRLVVGGAAASPSGNGRAKPTRSNLTLLARILGTVLPLMSNPEAVWRAIETEAGFSSRQITTLKERVGQVRPLLDMPKIKPVKASVIRTTQTAKSEEAPRTIAARKKAA